MEHTSIYDLKSIEGFKAMDWVRSVRKQVYELYTRDPEEYNRQLKAAGKRMRERAAQQAQNV